MKCGFSKKCINPPLGTPLVGYYSERLTKGVLDDLYIKAAAFDDGEKKAVVIEIDVCLLSEEFCDTVRSMIAEFCGIDANAVFICCDHTHTGPITMPDFASDKAPDPAYIGFLQTSLRDTAAYALKDLKPARFFAAEAQAKGISFIRRYKMKDGIIKTNPVAEDPNIDYPLGEPNETVKLLKIVRDGGDDLFIVSYGTHTDTTGGEYVSADYPTYLSRTIEGALPGTNCMFLLGPQGDVNHFDPSKPNRGRVRPVNPTGDYRDACSHAQYMGRVIAGSVLSVCDKAQEISADAIRFGSCSVEIPSQQENDALEESIRINDLYESGRQNEIAPPGTHLTPIIAKARRVIRLKDGPSSFEYKLFAVRIGDYVFAGLPGEPFTEIRNRIEAESPFANTMVCCLVNSSPGYFPTSQAYREGGYEVLSSVFGMGCDDALVNGMKDLLDSLK